MKPAVMFSGVVELMVRLPWPERSNAWLELLIAIVFAVVAVPKKNSVDPEFIVKVWPVATDADMVREPPLAVIVPPLPVMFPARAPEPVIKPVFEIVPAAPGAIAPWLTVIVPELFIDPV